MTADTEIKRIVRERYSSAALGKGSCCGPKICCDSGNDAGGPDLGLDMIGDAYQAVDGYLPEADLGLGCGLPTQHAGIKEGDIVLDLGSGAGIDAFVARRIVGKRGRVIGVDMTPEMIALARRECSEARLRQRGISFGRNRAPAYRNRHGRCRRQQLRAQPRSEQGARFL